MNTILLSYLLYVNIQQARNMLAFLLNFSEFCGWNVESGYSAQEIVEVKEVVYSFVKHKQYSLPNNCVNVTLRNCRTRLPRFWCFEYRTTMSRQLHTRLEQKPLISKEHFIINTSTSYHHHFWLTKLSSHWRGTGCLCGKWDSDMWSYMVSYGW